MITTNNGRETDDGQENAETVRTRRKLGVCKGEAHTLMLEEMLKGANVVISGDSGIYLGSCCLTKCFCFADCESNARAALKKWVVAVSSCCFHHTLVKDNRIPCSA